MEKILNEEKRIFIGISIADSVKEEIYDFTSKLLGGEERIRIIPSANIHLTMKFLGNTGIQKIPEIEKAIRNTAEGIKKFNYGITGEVGAFPDPGNARIVFLKIGNGTEAFLRIYDRLEEDLGRIKIRKEKRKFSPHLTIARIRDRKNLENLFKEKRGDPYKLKCQCITLFESKLRPMGAEYTILEEFSLK